MWRLLLGTMGVKSLVQGLNAAATAGFEPRTVWSEVRRRNRLATALLSELNLGTRYCSTSSVNGSAQNSEKRQGIMCRRLRLYSRTFLSAKNFVKSNRQAVHQESIFVKRWSSLVCSLVVRLLLFCLSFIFTFMNISDPTLGPFVCCWISWILWIRSVTMHSFILNFTRHKNNFDATNSCPATYRVGSVNFSWRKIGHVHDNSADSESGAGAREPNVHAHFIFVSKTVREFRASVF